MRMINSGRMAAFWCVVAMLAAAPLAAQPPAGDAPKPDTKPAEAKQPETKPAAPAQPPKAEPKGVKETRPNGLEIEDLRVGDGVECKPGWIAEVNYKGTLKADGKQFESTYGSEPLLAPVNRLIPGWKEGIIGMKVGGKRRLGVPASLAYADKGRSDIGIPAGADLIYDIELLNVIQVEELKVGEGTECKRDQTVTVHYRGTLRDTGKEFDSSYSRNAPSDLTLKTGPGGVIDGWLYGIPGMKVGGKRKLTIPWQRAYGEQGRPPMIPARADLVFEVELVGVK